MLLTASQHVRQEVKVENEWEYVDFKLKNILLFHFRLTFL